MPKLLQSFAALVFLVVGGVANAQPFSPTDRLLDAIGLGETLEIMRDEGLEYGATLGAEMLGGQAGAGWDATLSQLYDTEAMARIVRRDFATQFGDAAIEPLLEFFTTPDGKEIVALELGARRAMQDDAVEQMAKDNYLAIAGTDDPQLARITEYVEINDLIEYNVMGGLQSNLMFYRGLAQGGAIEMSEDEMTADVWSQEEDTRFETREWMFGYLMMAYQPLSEGQMQAYIDLSKTPSGRVLNRALFSAYDTLYSEISLGLGLAIAARMGGQDL